MIIALKNILENINTVKFEMSKFAAKSLPKVAITILVERKYREVLKLLPQRAMLSLARYREDTIAGNSMKGNSLSVYGTYKLKQCLSDMLLRKKL